MQGAHHFAGGVKIRCEIVHAKQCNRCEQADLPGAVNMSVSPLFPLGAALYARKIITMRRAMEKNMLFTLNYSEVFMTGTPFRGLLIERVNVCAWMHSISYPARPWPVRRVKRGRQTLERT